MGEVLVDSDVLLDVLTDDPNWFGWSSRALEQCAQEHSLAINAVIYAEVSVGFERIEEMESAVPESRFRRLGIPLDAAFLAGKCFVRYRESGGQRRSPLPDFFIGAHAAVAGMKLLTRDSRRYRTYFPGLKLIAPPTPGDP
jgi:predicted nucleic acid-binding protein